MLTKYAMIVPEIILITAICPWLTLEEFVRLDSASSTVLHAEFRRFVQSHIFGGMYGKEVKTLCETRSGKPSGADLLVMLNWLRVTDVHVRTALFFNEPLLFLLDDDSCSTAAQPFLFVERVELAVSPIHTALAVSLLPGCFPNLHSIKISLIRTEGEVSTLLGFAIMLSKLFPLTELEICCDIPLMLSPYNVRLLGRLIISLGRRLEWLKVGHFDGVPLSLLNLLSQHCPNVRNLFPGCKFSAVSVSSSNYLEAVKSLQNLEIIDLRENFSLDEEEFVSLLQHLPRLKRIFLPRRYSKSMVLVMFVHAVHMCPMLKEINNAAWFRVDMKGKEAASIMFNPSLDSFDDDIGSQLFSLLPPITSLTVSSWTVTPILTTATALAFSRQLFLGGNFGSIAELMLRYHVCDLFSVIPLFEHLAGLKKLTIAVLDTKTGFSSFLKCLCAYCPSLCSFRMSTSEVITDSDFCLLTSIFPCIDDVSIRVLKDGSDAVGCNLGKNVLSCIAKTGRPWREAGFPVGAVTAKDIISAIEGERLTIGRIEILPPFYNVEKEVIQGRFGKAVTVQDVADYCRRFPLSSLLHAD